MINVLIKYDVSRKFESLTLKGHANSAEFGHDLVCAAISGIVLGGINALEGKQFSVKQSDGYLELKNLGEISMHDKIVIDVIIKQIDAVRRDNPNYIKVSIN